VKATVRVKIVGKTEEGAEKGPKVRKPRKADSEEDRPAKEKKA